MERRYETLDGLRGVAAVVVVLHHMSTWTRVDWLVPHGYLAVDFFFMLSGFVVAHAYEKRLPEKGRLWFAWVRFVRLWPLIIAGAALGWFAQAMSPGRTASGWTVLTAFVTAVALYPWSHPQLNGGHIYPANTPFWSLGFEVAANVVWALFLPLITGRRLLVFIAICGAVMLWLTQTKELGDLGTDYWPLGFPRVGFAFGLGLACHRWRDRFTFGLPFLPLAGAIIALPWIVGPTWLDVVIVGIAMPLIVLAGANSPSGGPIIRGLGELSYPLYAVHYPLGQAAFALGWPWWGYLPLAFAASGAVLVLYDRPVRALLTRASNRRAGRGIGRRSFGLRRTR